MSKPLIALNAFVIGMGFGIALILGALNYDAQKNGTVIHHNNHPDRQCTTDMDCYGHGGYEL